MSPKSSFNNYAVIGLGFGDEGKGLTVNFLAQMLDNPIVVRYSGGQQAGHTVTLPNGTSHIFSNFGSGTLYGHQTYWSKYCTFDPACVKREWKVLTDKTGVMPGLFIDRHALVTTPYDKWYNRNHSKAMSHGTCGLGVGATFKREAANCSFLVGDLEYPEIIKMKLNAVRDYYMRKVGVAQINAEDMNNFLESCNFITKTPYLFISDKLFSRPNYIFEGSQGLLLDQKIGFYPHITPSNTGTKNILEMCSSPPQLYLVTRAYQTRHGNGPMTNENIPHTIKVNPKETNVQNCFQGQFRRTVLDLDLLKYGMERDDYIRETNQKTLVVTCLDHVENQYMYTADGKIVVHPDKVSFLNGISEYLKIPDVMACSSPDGDFERFLFKKDDYRGEFG